ncbi:MAG: GDSL-type esterase/lipase family protein [Chitinophagaceae bacterium]
MKKIFLLSFLLAGITSFAQKFDLGTGKTAAGYIKVKPDTKYSDQHGYGFTHGRPVSGVNRKTSNPLTSDFITSDSAFFFSVKLPDGNYNVKLFLGDVKGTSATTVRVENRRLMLSNIRTAKGQIITKTFTVHVRDSLIRDKEEKIISKVRLKSREVNYLHWDNLLTIEFNDSASKVCAIEISPNKIATTIFLAGNSTVVDQDREPWAAWGQMFPVFFEPGNIAIANYAESGETLKAFKGERRLEKIWSIAKPGDYLFIEFAHNDQKPGSSHLDAFTTYKETLKEWINEARSRKMIPVLVTSMNRRSFDSTGHIVNTLEGYPEAMRQTAKEENTALIDLNAMSKTLYEAWGPEGSIKAFVHYPANTFPGQTEALKDNTHFNPYGAYELARCIVQALKATNLGIVKFLKKDIPVFDPAHPDPVAKWYWPMSPKVEAVKPDGN